MPLNTLPSLISGRSLRTQIAWVFGALVVTLAVLLSLGFGEALKRRIQGDANASLQMVTDNTAAFLAHGLFERIREVQVLADADGSYTKALGMNIVGEGWVNGRSKRYAMLVADGVVTELQVEESPGACALSSGDSLLDLI